MRAFHFWDGAVLDNRSITFLRGGTLRRNRRRGTAVSSFAFISKWVNCELAKSFLWRIVMKKLALGLVAAGALITATAVPAMAQIGVYAGPGGFGVGIGVPGPYYGGPYYNSGPYYNGGYYNYAPGWNGNWQGHRHYRNYR
jgi:hypothetical protein